MKNLYSTAILFLFAFGLQSQIVITEIMYNPPEGGSDSLEYLEIYNESTSTINLNGWQLSGVTYTFGEVSINPDEYLVVAVDSAAMRRNFGITTLEWSGGALSNGGELVTISNDVGAIVSMVDFDVENGWPTSDDGTDGEGSSIELCDPSADNTNPANWQASQNDLGFMINGRIVKGTPGTPSTFDCPSMADVVVEVSSFEFTPKDITINKGETVRWENKGGTHNVNGQQSVYPDNPDSFFSGNPSGEAWIYEYTFDIPGFYDYQCDPHVAQNMFGTITVLDPADALPKLVITEIMYNDPAMVDSLEFIELYNNDDDAIDLAGFSFDTGPQFTFPNMMLPAGDFMIIAQDSATFKKYFGIDAFQYESGGLGSDGDVILIVNSVGDTIDVLSYTDRAPWPDQADGQGFSLILCDPDADNSMAENWGAATFPTGFNYEGVSIFADPGDLSYCLKTIDEASITDADGVSTMEGNR
ncbi:MAG: hypothetical protein HKN68_13280, partial [Saprospiraceae bacterium]|nr:hypothetical protein [Saprospiraceae bacterium]